MFCLFCFWKLLYVCDCFIFVLVFKVFIRFAMVCEIILFNVTSLSSPGNWSLWNKICLLHHGGVLLFFLIIYKKLVHVWWNLQLFSVKWFSCFYESCLFLSEFVEERICRRKCLLVFLFSCLVRCNFLTVVCKMFYLFLSNFVNFTHILLKALMFFNPRFSTTVVKTSIYKWLKTNIFTTCLV